MTRRYTISINEMDGLNLNVNVEADNLLAAIDVSKIAIAQKMAESLGLSVAIVPPVSTNVNPDHVG